MAISKIDSKALTDSSVVDADIADGTITSAKLAGSVANAKLQNSTVTINGTAVALGASASLDAISWQAVKTAAFNAVVGEGYFVNTTSGVITVTLPASPSIGDTIAIKDYAGTYATNNLTIARNGKNIQGVANDSLISTNRASLILVFVDDTRGWVYTVESNVANLEAVAFISATGGTVATSGDYKVHSFTGDGCFVVSCAGGVGPGPSSVDYLVVAGGGAGGGGRGGGGGAGGFRLSNSTCMPAPLTSPLADPTGVPVSVTTYPITVGAGASASPGVGPSGSNSVFSTITSTGGGGGGQDGGPGGNGGSGGGGGESSTCSNIGLGNTPPVSPSQGNPGGASQHAPPTGGPHPVSPAPYAGGGGGGAGAQGGRSNESSPAGAGGPGGIGSFVSPSFSVSCAGTTGPVPGVRYFAGGGGGYGCATANPGGTVAGGAGGGGAGGANAGVVGTVNTGGGGGAEGNIPGGIGAAGGSGIVIIRYKFQ